MPVECNSGEDADYDLGFDSDDGDEPSNNQLIEDRVEALLGPKVSKHLKVLNQVKQFLSDIHFGTPEDWKIS
jgi:hypothetical protein